MDSVQAHDGTYPDFCEVSGIPSIIFDGLWIK